MILSTCSAADPGFPVRGAPTCQGGIDLQHGCFLVETYAKTKDPPLLFVYVDPPLVKLKVFENKIVEPSPLADPGGTANRIQFFRFRIRFRQKAPASEVSTPQWLGAPKRKILDPPLLSYSHICQIGAKYQLKMIPETKCSILTGILPRHNVNRIISP